ncbi:MAG TPA: hypothetical protein VFO18_17775 [Methylomirabilota bacterium]|nr:hypothetical protein [Methylomirabilota bacterium]
MSLKAWLAAVVAAGLLAAALPASAIGLRVGQPAPEISGGPWINSAPLSMAELRGRVVLVEFWTFG